MIRFIRLTASIVMLAVWLQASSQQLQWTVRGHQPVAVEPSAASGLDAVWVVQSPAGASVSFTPPQGVNSLIWSRFSSMGAAYAEPVATTVEGGKWTLNHVESDMGYIIEYPDGRHYAFWVTDWSSHPYDVTAVTVDESDCSTSQLTITGQAGRLTYTSINGRDIEIDRDIEITYMTMVYDPATARFAAAQTTEHRAWLAEHTSLPAPLCATSFTISGDHFLQSWGQPSQVSSSTVQPVAIDCHTDAIQAERDNDNEQKVEGAELGGSAPVEVTFSAAVTEAAIFTEWQISTYPEFDVVDYSTADLEFDYTFTEAGTRYVRFTAANDDASCEWASDVYTVFVGESDLQIPNAFSPNASEGVNDIWKVSYKSIVSFECHIFNKWGQQLYEFNDPAGGWDGRYHGKFVPAGVYYYVIKATGADGRNWDRAGDINIVGYK